MVGGLPTCHRGVGAQLCFVQGADVAGQDAAQRVVGEHDYHVLGLEVLLDLLPALLGGLATLEGAVKADSGPLAGAVRCHDLEARWLGRGADPALLAEGLGDDDVVVRA